MYRLECSSKPQRFFCVSPLLDAAEIYGSFKRIDLHLQFLSALDPKYSRKSVGTKSVRWKEIEMEYGLSALVSLTRSRRSIGFSAVSSLIPESFCSVECLLLLPLPGQERGEEEESPSSFSPLTYFLAVGRSREAGLLLSVLQSNHCGIGEMEAKEAVFLSLLPPFFRDTRGWQAKLWEKGSRSLRPVSKRTTSCHS